TIYVSPYRRALHADHAARRRRARHARPYHHRPRRRRRCLERLRLRLRAPGVPERLHLEPGHRADAVPAVQPGRGCPVNAEAITAALQNLATDEFLRVLE